MIARDILEGHTTLTTCRKWLLDAINRNLSDLVTFIRLPRDGRVVIFSNTMRWSQRCMG